MPLIPTHEEPSRLHSWFTWKLLSQEGLFSNTAYRFPRPLSEFYEGTGSDVCVVCGGWGEVRLKGRHLYCICQTLHWQGELVKTLAGLRSRVDPASFEDIKERKDHPNRGQLGEAVDAARKWAAFPRGYLVIYGPYGVGKSHILRALNLILHPIAVYVTASDFEQRVYEAVKGNTLSDYVYQLARSPVLLFDDLGMEYGGDLAAAKLAHVVDFRDRQWEDFPMAFTTNLNEQGILSIPRIGSRLLNRDRAQVLSILLSDFRTRRV